MKGQVNGTRMASPAAAVAVADATNGGKRKRGEPKTAGVKKIKEQVQRTPIYSLAMWQLSTIIVALETDHNL